jgi:hypothetical protein
VEVLAADGGYPVEGAVTVALKVKPLTLKQANEHVAALHRHHKPARGHRFSLGCFEGEKLVGACIVGRPVARMTNQYSVAEVIRLVTDGTKNACSILYAAAARAARAMGFDQIQTFILESEPGTSLRASGWSLDGLSGGGEWGRDGRPRANEQPTEPKTRWVKRFA